MTSPHHHSLFLKDHRSFYKWLLGCTFESSGELFRNPDALVQVSEILRVQEAFSYATEVENFSRTCFYNLPHQVSATQLGSYRMLCDLSSYICLRYPQMTKKKKKGFLSRVQKVNSEPLEIYRSKMMQLQILKGRRRIS